MADVDTFVSGAMVIDEDRSSLHVASQDMSDGASQEPVLRRTSLETPMFPPSHIYTTIPEDEIAISTALPLSDDEESELQSIGINSDTDRRRQSQGPSFESATSSYSSTIDALSLHLTHLVNIKASSRTESVNVTCYDYSSNALHSVKAFSAKRTSKNLQTAEGELLREYLSVNPSEQLQLRLIVANDLSTDLIHCLGTSLSISPEIYEEHLVNSGWQNGTDNDQQPETWITRNMKKPYMSLRWYRPVKRAVQRPSSAIDRLEFLKSPTDPFRWIEAVQIKSGEPRKVIHVSRPATNILRQNWDIKTDAEAESSTGGFIAWEERATVWNKRCGGLDVAVLLLDPLPIIEDKMTGAVKALQRLGVDSTELADEQQVVSPGPVEREDITPSARPKGYVRSSTISKNRTKMRYFSSIKSLGRLLLQRPSHPQGPSGSDGPATEGSEAFQPVTDPESGERGEERPQRTKGTRRPRARGVIPEFFDRFFQRPKNDIKEPHRAQTMEVREEKKGTKTKTLESMNRCLFEELYPRGPAVDYDFLMDHRNAAYLADYLDRTKSTAATLAEWLTEYDHRKTCSVTPTIHLEFLFAIIQNDTMNTLRHMDIALQDIGQLILDDTLIQQRLLHWRLLLERFETELQQLEVSLRGFANFIDIYRVPRGSDNEQLDERTPSVEKLLEQGVSQIRSLRQRTNRSHKSLMANMSIVESKRGIAEAESVTKLTELAFFFIPLTFSASIFSMQVKELNASRISIAAFFILATIITAASYVLRLVIRSESFINFRVAAMKDIRQGAGLAPGFPIPSSTFLAWVWRRIGLLTVLVTTLVAVLVVPIAVLWTKDINHGFKVLITILLLAFILVASYVTGNAMLYMDAEGLHLRRNIFKPGVGFWERPYQARWSFSKSMLLILSWIRNGWVLLSIGLTVVCASPAAALWTSQLTTGIKVAVTVVITAIYITILVLILISALQDRLLPAQNLDDNGGRWRRRSRANRS